MVRTRNEATIFGPIGESRGKSRGACRIRDIDPGVGLTRSLVAGQGCTVVAGVVSHRENSAGTRWRLESNSQSIRNTQYVSV